MNDQDNWQQYAKEGENAQQCIERHRSEQDALLTLLSKARMELGRAYRCVQGMHHALSSGSEFTGEAYHAPTIGAAKRFVFEGSIDGSEYFTGKHVSALHAALALPESTPTKTQGGEA